MMNHPEVNKFANEYVRSAEQKGWYRKELGHAELRFLDNVLGPLLHYQFDGLFPEYPFKDFKGGDRFIDFVYTKGGIRLVTQDVMLALSISQRSAHYWLQHFVKEGWLIPEKAERKTIAYIWQAPS